MTSVFQVSVKWEVINEEDENKVNKGTVIKKEPSDAPKNVAEHDIFGGAVSDSEEEDGHLNVLDVLDENSQNSADDSHLTDSNSVLVSSNHPISLKKITFLKILESFSGFQTVDRIYQRYVSRNAKFSQSHGLLSTV